MGDGLSVPFIVFCKSLLIAGAIVIMIDGRQNCNCELAFKLQSLRVIKNRIKIAEFNFSGSLM